MLLLGTFWLLNIFLRPHPFHKCPHKFELTLLSAIKHSIKYKIAQKSPVLNSTLENLGCPHMLQSLLRAQFTLPHLQTKQKEYLMT